MKLLELIEQKLGANRKSQSPPEPTAFQIANLGNYFQNKHNNPSFIQTEDCIEISSFFTIHIQVKGGIQIQLISS